MNIGEDFKDLVERPACARAGLTEYLDAVASRAEEVEVGTRSRRRNGGYWHDDFSEKALGTIATALQAAADAVGLGEDVPSMDEDTPVRFLVGELPDYVDALAADHSGRDIAQFVDTLNLRIRSLLSAGRLAA